MTGGLAAEGRVVPLFRRGSWYRSLDLEAPFAESDLRVCTAPALMALSDFPGLRGACAEATLGPLAVRAERLSQAARLFRHERLEIEGWGSQTPADFFELYAETQGVSPAVTQGWAEQLLAHSQASAARPVAPATGVHFVVLPSNTFTCLESCIDAALAGSALAMRPSRREPLSAVRWLASLLAAGWPAEAVALYITTPEAVPRLVKAADEATIYGDEASVDAYRGDPKVTIHGPLRAAVVLGAGLPVEAGVSSLLALLSDNAGRFCSNIHTILTLGKAAALGERLAAELDQLPLDPERGLVPFWPARARAEQTAAWLRERLRPGDRVLTRRSLLLSDRGRHYVAPTLIWLAEPKGHPLLGFELPLPCAVLAEVSAEDLPFCRTKVGTLQEIGVSS
jgi:acyl-CoA reductase-like NAD-dependent aldehyde dehydrogenase